MEPIKATNGQEVTEEMLDGCLLCVENDDWQNPRMRTMVEVGDKGAA